ncbi:MAG: hypothetical protein HZA54_19675 [Planctomycetes bacterium]|nr:hypothetical protein [Planctomycetota bacterium]
MLSRRPTLALAAGLAAFAVLPALRLFSDDVAIVPIFPWATQAIFGEKEVTIGGSAIVDGMAGAPAPARSNKLVTVKNDGRVVGDAVSGGLVALKNNGVVTGNVLEHQPQLALPAVLGSIKTRAFKNDNATIGLTDQGTDPLIGTKFKMKDNQTMTLPSGRYYFTELSLDDNAVLRMAGTTTIYLDGPMRLKGNSHLNENNECVLLLLSAEGPSQDMKMSGDSKAWGGFYGMATDFKMGDNAELFGAVAALTVTLNGTSRLHFQSAFRDTLGFKIDTETTDPTKVFDD